MIPNQILELIDHVIGKNESSEIHMAPTVLYNEGWMIRFLTLVSKQRKLKMRGIDFGSLTNWYSEGLLASPFPPAFRKDPLGEGYTHVDMMLGDFTVKPEERGEIEIAENSKSFGVLEAKMKSRLSPGTARVKWYDQASRNLACLAYAARHTQHEIFFGVVAPEKTICKQKFEHFLSKSRLLRRIGIRFELYKRALTIKSIDSVILEKYAQALQEREATLAKVESANCFVLSFEDWLEELSGDSDLHQALVEFYELCKKYNRVDPS